LTIPLALLAGLPPYPAVVRAVKDPRAGVAPWLLLARGSRLPGATSGGAEAPAAVGGCGVPGLRP
jgi:hypothetical protein